MIDFENLKIKYPEFIDAFDTISTWKFDLVEPRKIFTYPGVTEDNVLDIIMAVGAIREEGLADNEWMLINKVGRPFPKVYQNLEEIPKALLNHSADLFLNTRLKR